MKNVFLLLSMFLLMGTGHQMYAQSIPTYPIPSYNVKVDGTVNFQEQSQEDQGDSPLARRKVKVGIGSVSNQPSVCEASVLVYRLDQSISYGPYTVGCGQTLDVEIDYNLWGVLVESEVEVFVDVYIE